MANFYYELHQGAIKELGHKYFVATGKTGDAAMAGGWAVTQHSDRIWREDGNEIRFVKNRYNIDYNSVDLKEFMWVKLSAETIKGA